MSGDELRITRGSRLGGKSPIALDDWRRAADATPYVGTPDRSGAAIVDRGPDGAPFALTFRDGEVVGAPPDAAGVRSMIAIAERLGADVVARSGEVYGLRNNVLVTIGEDGTVSPLAGRKPSRPRPWWRFW